MSQPADTETPRSITEVRRAMIKDRRLLVYNLRESGYTFVAIAKQLNVSVTRAREIYKDHARGMQSDGSVWTDGLSGRLINCFSNMGLGSREEVLAAFVDGRLDPRPSKRPHNYGRKSHKELAAWLGLPEPAPAAGRTYTPNACCPHCGERL